VEGAQGLGLDITHGEYPYLTSSHCCATDCLNMGIPFRYVRDIYGVAKAYDTYVGAKVFQTEGDEVLHQLQVAGEEFGATTGRQRQCNYLNLDFLIRSININSCTKVILNKCDILKGVDGSWKYIYKGELRVAKSYGSWETDVYNILLRETLTDRNSIKFSFSKSDI
jgi:adenylosuccinate synthase